MLSNIGDAVLTTPALECLHPCYPEAVIDLLADARALDALEHCPNRGDIFLKEKSGGSDTGLAARTQHRQTPSHAILSQRECPV
jgi:ADP-heptose:LPS heptosyltransferase